MNAKKHKLSEREFSVIEEAAEKTEQNLRTAVHEFVSHLLVNELSNPLSASAVAQHVLFHVSEAMCILYGMSAEDVRENEDALATLTIRLQKQMVVAVAEFVRTHMDEENLYVSPEERKQADAAERAEYEYDRDKEERIDNSRN